MNNKELKELNKEYDEAVYNAKARFEIIMKLALIIIVFGVACTTYKITTSFSAIIITSIITGIACTIGSAYLLEKKDLIKKVQNNSKEVKKLKKEIKNKEKLKKEYNAKSIELEEKLIELKNKYNKVIPNGYPNPTYVQTQEESKSYDLEKNKVKKLLKI